VFRLKTAYCSSSTSLGEVRIHNIKITYEFRRSPVKRQVTQYITNNIHDLDACIGDCE
jgi:hypothetical protein